MNFRNLIALWVQTHLYSPWQFQKHLFCWYWIISSDSVNWIDLPWFRPREFHRYRLIIHVSWSTPWDSIFCLVVLVWLYRSFSFQIMSFLKTISSDFWFDYGRFWPWNCRMWLVCLYHPHILALSASTLVLSQCERAEVVLITSRREIGLKLAVEGNPWHVIMHSVRFGQPRSIARQFIIYYLHELTLHISGSAKLLSTYLE